MRDLIPIPPPSGRVTIESQARIEGSYSEPNTEQSLVEYGVILWQKLPLILGMGVLLGAMALAYSVQLLPRYVAKTKLEVEDINENFLNRREIDPNTSGNPQLVDTFLQTQVEVMQSDALISRVVKKLNLEHNPEHLNLGVGQAEKYVHKFGLDAWLNSLDKDGHPSFVRRFLGIPPATEALDPNRALEVAKKNLKAQATSQNRIVELSYTAPDPHVAAEFLNTLTDEFVDYSLETRWNETQRTGQSLQQKLEAVRSDLEKSEKQLQQYAADTGLVFASEKDNIAEDKLRRLQSDLSSAQSDLAEKQAKFDLLSIAPADSLPDVLGSAQLADFQSRLLSLKTQLAQAAVTMTPKNARVKEFESQIEQVQHATVEERANILQRIRNEYETSKRRESLLDAAFKAQSAIVSSQAVKAVRYNTLKQETDSARQFYENMLQKLKMTDFASAMRSSNVRIIDRAEPPLLPAKPNLLLNTGVGSGAGFALGVFMAFILERRRRSDRSLKAPGQSILTLDLPELGVIPSIDGLAYHDASLTKRLAQPRLISLNAKIAEKNIGSFPAKLTIWETKGSIVADSYRAALTSILFGRPGSASPAVIAITSTGRGEGKTCAAANLAVALTETGKKVLLIDADLRGPRLHEWFEVENHQGLCHLLESELDLATCDEKLLSISTKAPNLSLLPGGRSDAAGLQLLYSTRLSQLLERCRRAFDVVLIDTPPVFLYSDARLLGRLSDGVVMIIRSGVNPPEIVKQACGRMMEDGVPILGTILNDWRPAKGSQAAYYYSEAQTA
jgi:succinoglycan biosynthesis transport protein ExoP